MHSRLLEIHKQLNSAQHSLPSENATHARAEDIRERALLVDGLVTGAPTALELRDEDRHWLALDRQFTTQRKLLTSHANSLEEQIQFLETQQSVWQATWDQVHQIQGIEAVINRVWQELNAIKATRSQVQQQLNLVLTLQNQISQDGLEITAVLTKLSDAQDQLRGHLLERDGHPIWETRESRNLDRAITFSFRKSVDRDLQDSEEFLSMNSFRALFVLLLYGVCLLAALRFAAYLRIRGAAGLPQEALLICSRPYAMALLLTLILTHGRFQSETTGVAFLFALLWLIPTLRLLPPLIKPEYRSFLYAFVPVFVLEGGRILTRFSPAIKRDLFVLNMLIALVLLVWLVRSARRSHPRKAEHSRVLIVGGHTGIVVLAACLLCNFLGFISLSQVLGMCVIIGFLGAAALYTVVRVFAAILNVGLQTEWAQSMLQARTEAVERWASRLLVYAALLVWFRAIFQLFGVYDKFVGILTTIFQYPFGYGHLQFTLGGSLSVLLLMIVGYVIARSFNFLLTRFVLPKIPLQRGVAYAVSTVTYYVLLLLVAVVTLSATGIELDKFTVLTGAIGVGLGFGLQNVVNNFVSGLILLFERPIHVGDIVDVGALVGTVRRIGARSCTVVTFQGAEVIVPNSNLLSSQLINWTLSAPWRRVDLPVHVAYGTDPERVLKLLVEVAESTSGVWRVRPPAAYFLGFGDSALKFELRFWSAEQDTWFQLQSNVAIAVTKALQEAGIEIPFPQRDLHLRSVDASVRTTFASGGAGPLSIAQSPMPEPAIAEPLQPSQTGRNPRQ